MQPMKFKANDLVQHVKTGRRYQILIGADTCRLEADAASAYAYRLADPQPPADPTVWVRDAAQMEDGRFTLQPSAQ